MTISLQIRTLLFHLATSLHNGLPVSSQEGEETLGYRKEWQSRALLVMKFLCDP